MGIAAYAPSPDFTCSLLHYPSRRGLGSIVPWHGTPSGSRDATSHALRAPGTARCSSAAAHPARGPRSTLGARSPAREPAAGGLPTDVGAVGGDEPAPTSPHVGAGSGRAPGVLRPARSARGTYPRGG